MPSPLGTVLVNDDYPLYLQNNFLRVEGPRPELTAAQLVEEAWRGLNAAGRTRLQVVIEDEATGARLAPGLRTQGWWTDLDVVMTWERRRRCQRLAPTAVRAPGLRPPLSLVIVVDLLPELDTALYFTAVVLFLVQAAWTLLWLVFMERRRAGDGPA